MSGYNTAVSEAKANVIRAGRMLVEKGLVARTWGNISARISDTEFAVTPSGRAYETLTEDEIVVVRMKDCSYDGDIKPSSEKGIHADAYMLRPDVDFVIHTHQFFASAVSITGSPITDLSEEQCAVLGRIVPCAGYGLSSTEKLRRNVRKALEENPEAAAVLMRSHGALCVGKDMEEAFSASMALEEAAEKVFTETCGELQEKESSVTGYRIYEAGSEGEFAGSLGPLLRAGRKCAIVSGMPFTVEMSRRGKRLRPYIDDQAQIIGTCIESVRADAPSVEIRDALGKRAAVFLNGHGAVCFGSDEAEAMAVCMILEKGCAAAYFAENAPDARPVDAVSAALERSVYTKKYSKLKTKRM